MKYFFTLIALCFSVYSYAVDPLIQQEQGVQFMVDAKKKIVQYWLPLKVEYSLLNDGAKNNVMQVSAHLDLSSVKEIEEILSRRFPNYQVIMGSKRTVKKIESDIVLLRNLFEPLKEIYNLEFNEMVNVTPSEFALLNRYFEKGETPPVKVYFETINSVSEINKDTVVDISSICQQAKLQGKETFNSLDVFKFLSDFKKNYSRKISYEPSMEEILSETVNSCFSVRNPLRTDDQKILLKDLVMEVLTPAGRKLPVSSDGTEVAVAKIISGQFIINGSFLGETEI